MIMLSDLDITLGDLGHQCRARRAARKQSLRDAAADVGMSFGRYYEIEHGSTNLSVSTLRLLLAWLGDEQHAPADDPTRQAAAQALRDAAEELGNTALALLSDSSAEGHALTAAVLQRAEVMVRSRADRLAALEDGGR